MLNLEIVGIIAQEYKELREYRERVKEEYDEFIGAGRVKAADMSRRKLEELDAELRGMDRVLKRICIL